MAKQRSSPYVEVRAGWRALFISVLLAAVFGMGFRLYFSPPRLKAWVTAALDQQKRQMAHPFALSFSDVSLRLAQGSLPQLAVVVTDVRVAPNPECHPEASVFIGELRLPFRVLALLSGRAAVGVIGARDITVDLDGLRARCDGASVGETKGSQGASAASSNATAGAAPVAAEPRGNRKATNLAETAIKLTETKADIGPAKPWWTDEQYETVRSFVQGLEFSHATLQFEKKSKEIYLDSFSVLFKRGGLLALETEIRIPPTVTYGEQVPALKIQGEAVSTKANLVVRARVSEGDLTSTAVLTPGVDQGLLMDAQMGVKSLPLSMLIPLMRKAGLADSRFQPKFLWLDCSASINGPFQGLFQKSPLRLQRCRIEGDGTDIQLESAERSPQGEWKPFDVNVVSMDVAKLLATVGVQGPAGVANDFGKIDGRIHVESQQEAKFAGVLHQANISFSNRKIQAVQTIETMAVEISILKDHLKTELKDFKLRNGEASGRAELVLNRHLQQGEAKIEFEKLLFDPEVQHVLVGGQLGAIEGGVDAKIENAQITDFNSDVKIDETRAQEFSFRQLKVHGTRRDDAAPHIVIEAPTLGLKKSSDFYKALQPLFFGHRFVAEKNEKEGLKADEIMFESPRIECLITDDGGVDWSKASASLEHGQILFSSDGFMNRDHVVDGALTIDYPKIKKLKWQMKGPLASPTLTGVGDAYSQLKSRVEIDDSVLGFKNGH